MLAGTPEHEALLESIAKHFDVDSEPTAALSCTASTLACKSASVDAYDATGIAVIPDKCSLLAALLCPVQEVLSLTDKPHIHAVTKGPLAQFFQVPEFFPLSQPGPDGRAVPYSQLEIRFFAEKLGYPVMLKGPHQGATLCRSWAAVNTVLATESWVHGGFLQCSVPGWEKCLAFAAYDGVLTGMVLLASLSEHHQ